MIIISCFSFRYVRSSHYKDFLENSRKKSIKGFIPKLSNAKLNIVNAKEQLKVGLSSNPFPIQKHSCKYLVKSVEVVSNGKDT